MSDVKHFKRYSQQMKLEPMGQQGQLRLQQARVLCIGAGGLGSSLLMYLAAAGIGKLGIVDDDVVEESNLHRQVLYQQRHLQKSKALIAKEQLHALNPLIKVQAHALRLNRDNAQSLITQYDVIADCTDNFNSRYLIHELCYQQEKPYVYASVYQLQGHCSLFYGKQAPCLCCLFPNIPNIIGNCEDGGVLGVLPGMLGVIQATEIIKWVVGFGSSLQGRLLVVDAFTMKFQEIRFVKQEQCSFCGG